MVDITIFSKTFIWKVKAGGSESRLHAFDFYVISAMRESLRLLEGQTTSHTSCKATSQKYLNAALRLFDFTRKINSNRSLELCARSMKIPTTDRLAKSRS